MITNYDGLLEECVVLEEWSDPTYWTPCRLAYYISDDGDALIYERKDPFGEWFESFDYARLPDFNEPEIPSGGFKLEFDGKMSIIIGQKNYGPMRLTIDDEECVNDVIRTFLKYVDGGMTVNSYEDEEGACMNKMLEFANE